VLRYTGADRNVTYDANTYTAKPIACGSIRMMGDTQADEFTITVPSSIQVVTDFNSVPPADRVQAVVRRWHYGDTDSAVMWAGFIDRAIRRDRSKTDLVCKSLTATFRRGGARLTWQRQCPHMLFDTECKVNKESHRVDAWVESKDAINLVATSLGSIASGRLTGGWVEWTTDSGFRAWRTISAHSGTTIAVLGGTVGIDVGVQIAAYPSCPRNAESCEALYNNLPNFGGIRHLPGKSPFDGNPVF
jgi:uncharacterized phage protein (TIGR02218 family)